MRKILLLPSVGLFLGLFWACSDAALVAAGGECFQAIDCEPGLVCIPAAGGKSVCSSDLTGIVKVPPEAGAPADAAPPSDATITYDSAVDAPPPPPPKDTGVPDNNPPPLDSGGNDAAPPQDSGGNG